MATEESTPILDIEGRVARIRLNRPSHRNRLERKDLNALMAHFEQIDANAAVHFIVLTGTVLQQRPVFSAGYNLTEDDEVAVGAGFGDVMDRIERLRPITICAMNGSVYGGASDMGLACDFTLGVHGMELRMPAAAIGLHYHPGGLVRWVSRLGIGNAKRVVLGAATFKAEELLAMGYLQQLVAPGEIEAAVNALLLQLSPLAPRALQQLKRSLNEVARGDIDMQRLQQRHEESLVSAEFREGCQAFAERRKPVFPGGAQ